MTGPGGGCRPFRLGASPTPASAGRVGGEAVGGPEGAGAFDLDARGQPLGQAPIGRDDP